MSNFFRRSRSFRLFLAEILGILLFCKIVYDNWLHSNVSFKGWTIIFYWGVTFFIKKLFASCNWLEKNACFKGMKGKNCLQSKGKFFKNTLIFKILTQIGLDIKVSFSFI